jgi:capsular exopolysaccharide synthesis family protein
MRDVAITSRESIISIFRSFQVLEATVTRMKLRLRIRSKDTFKRYYFQSVQYHDSLSLGTYTLRLLGNRQAILTFRPKQDGREEYTLFTGAIPADNRVKVPGLELALLPKAASRWPAKEIAMEFMTLDEAVDALREDLTLKPFGQSNMQATLKDRDPWLVADILNTLRDEFLRTYYGTTEVQEVGVLAQMEKDLESAKQKLERSQDDLSRFYAMHPELTARATTTPADNLSLMEARSELNAAEARLNRLRSTRAAKPSENDAEQLFFWANEILGVMIEAGEPKASILRAGLMDVRSREAALAGQLGPEHPRIMELRQKRAELFAGLDAAESALASRLSAQKADLQAKAARLAASAGMRPSVKVELELERLTSVNTNNQVIYDRVLEAYNRAKLVTGSEFFKVTVVDEARAALYVPPSFKTRIIIAAFAVIALLVAVPLAFLSWQILFPRIWSKEDIRRQLGIRTLGVVVQRVLPKAVKGGSRPRDADARARKGAEAGKESGDGAGGNSADDGGRAGEDGGKNSGSAMAAPSASRRVDPLLIFHGRASLLEDVEAFRIIREETENAFRNKARPGKYCLMVTSSHPHEGKSTCSANLALTFARKGKRTLLIDADFRLGRAARIFDLKVETGLDDILSQVDLTFTQFAEIAPMAYQATLQRDLVVAPRRTPNANAGELVSSDRFKAFVNMARDQFDVVIIDTPPVMITPEPLSLAELVDGVVFVCRSGVTVASEAKEAVSSLRERKVRVEALLNGVKDTPFQGSRYKKYNYYYQVQPVPGEPQASRG